MVVDANGNVVGYSGGITKPGVVMVVSAGESFEARVEGGLALPLLSVGFSDTNCATPVVFFGAAGYMPMAGEVFEAVIGKNSSGAVLQQYQRLSTSTISTSTAVNSYLDSTGTCATTSQAVTAIAHGDAVGAAVATFAPPLHLEVR